ncbi:MAG: DUF2066 domain-containing protein [Gammaproteobacteria bacterium]|nr:DUF2066 domain-containing protein [Gammaproteobacteria bacterium]
MLLPDAARAVRVPGVYAAEVDLPSGSNGLREAFDAALEQVLVKVSGRDSLGNAGARRSLVPDAGKLVRQYSRLPRGRVRVEFDGVQLERILDAAGQPVWGIERPLLAVWYAVDDGAGNRTILDGNDTSGRKGRLRAQLQAAADARGLPVVFPLVDAEDLSRMSFADVWGNFTAPLQQASRRYSADGLLIGRARSLSTGERRVRWTVVTRTEQFAWEGSVSGGPGEAASWLSQRLATVADTGGAVRLVVGDINSIDRLGRLQKYLRSLNIVQSAQIVQVRDDRIEFELQVRGDSSRLQRSLDNGRLLSRVTADAAPVAAGARRPDLIYNWASR